MSRDAAEKPSLEADYTSDPDDGYTWLEQVASEPALAWVRSRNTETDQRWSDDLYRRFEEDLLAVLDSTARIPYVEKLGLHYYNFWRDASHPRGVWRRTTPESYRLEQPAWEDILDLDALAQDEGEPWVWAGAQALHPAADRCLVKLSRGGADATVVREFDLPTRRFLPEGFNLPEAKARLSWRDRDSVFVATDTGPGSLTTSGYPRVARLWRRGTPLSAAEAVFEGAPGDVHVIAWRDDTPGYTRDFVQRAMSFFTTELFLWTGDALVAIPKPADATAAAWRDWLLLELRSPWEVDGHVWPAGALLAIGFDAFLAGDRAFQLLFAPTERASLGGWHATRSRVVAEVLDNVQGRVRVFTPTAEGWTAADMPGVPPFATVGVTPIDPHGSDDVFVTVTGYLTPTELRAGVAGGDAPTLLKQLPAFFDGSGLAVSQHEVVSADGTRVPYFLVSRAGLDPTGDHPTLLSGYGGFEIPMLPGYSAGAGLAWLARGGVYAVANLRGGGEFGPAWHQAALREKRPRAYEDFAAIAEDLIARRITRPERLGILGGSNGGLLVGNMLVRRPELFGAVVCQVPLLDMRRYSHLLAGASWTSEYGDPDDPEQWKFIRTFSPYHLVRPGVRYPPVLFVTSTRDDRVHPGHARKMAAKMVDFGCDVTYWENVEGGHGGAADNRQSARLWALTWRWLWGRLG